MKKFTLSLFAILIVSATFFKSCKDSEKDIAVLRVTLNQTTATLNIGNTFTLSATVFPENATNRTVTWISSNPAVATVNSNGLVTAESGGTATITVITQDGNRTATCVVTVIYFPVTGVTLNYPTATVLLGATLTLTPTILPANATNRTVTWSSSNLAVATVNSDGVVTAVSVGTATITVTTQDGNKTATCVVTVSPVVSIAGCNTNTPGWGASLGTVNRGNERTISGNGITQIWSDAVSASNCQKTTFNGGIIDWVIPENSDFNADCRSNPDHPGDLFSWCAVVRFQDVLCPYPWRVPTIEDFRDLDLALGGTGINRNSPATPQFIPDNYITRWGGAFGGFCAYNASLLEQDLWGYYWSQSEGIISSGRNLRFNTRNTIWPQGWSPKSNGLSLRCVR